MLLPNIKKVEDKKRNKNMKLLLAKIKKVKEKTSNNKIWNCHCLIEKKV